MDSEYYAKEAVNKIITASENLNEFPLIGRIVPELNNDNIREIFIYSYRLIYEITINDVNIITIVHGKRKFPEELDRIT